MKKHQVRIRISKDGRQHVTLDGRELDAARVRVDATSGQPAGVTIELAATTAVDIETIDGDTLQVLDAAEALDEGEGE